jgi:hypothetical protein
MHKTLVDSEAPTFHFGKEVVNKLTVNERSSRNASARDARRGDSGNTSAIYIFFFAAAAVRRVRAMNTRASALLRNKCVVTAITFPGAKAGRRQDHLTVTGEEIPDTHVRS